jgi:hypothetical protein
MERRGLQGAISELMSKAQADRDILRVAAAATRLAREHGGDSREIALLIIEAGLRSRINMEWGDTREPLAPAAQHASDHS